MDFFVKDELRVPYTPACSTSLFFYIHISDRGPVKFRKISYIFFRSLPPSSYNFSIFFFRAGRISTCTDRGNNFVLSSLRPIWSELECVAHHILLSQSLSRAVWQPVEKTKTKKKRNLKMNTFLTLTWRWVRLLLATNDQPRSRI